MKKFCIFCGGKPNERTKEHVLPYWLLEMTGDPNREVKIGIDPQSGREFSYAYSRFHFPACYSCNTEKSTFEANAQAIIKLILERKPILGSQIDILLDWLDKVRVGLWLGYNTLFKNPLKIVPNFHINDRIGKKDRYLSLYFFEKQKMGLSVVNADTLGFQFSPNSIFMKINDVGILNGSSDFLVSARSGFPFPKEAIIDLDQNGYLSISNFQKTSGPKFPILKNRPPPSVLTAYQAILPKFHSSELLDMYNEFMPDLEDYLINGIAPKGKIIIEDRTIRFIEPQDPVEYREVDGYDVRTLGQIAVYSLQMQKGLLGNIKFQSMNSEILKHVNGVLKTCQAQLKSRIKAFDI